MINKREKHKFLEGAFFTMIIATFFSAIVLTGNDCSSSICSADYRNLFSKDASDASKEIKIVKEIREDSGFTAVTGDVIYTIQRDAEIVILREDSKEYLEYISGKAVEENVIKENTIPISVMLLSMLIIYNAYLYLHKESKKNR